MKKIETKVGGKPIRMTALALAAAQVAMLYSYAAQAQTTDATAAADTGSTTTVVVTGQRRALETAQKIKQEAEQVVDSVVADEAGKLPDKSITEVLQRVVGVTMDRNRSRSNNSPLGGDSLAFSAEGSGVQVRGLSWGSSTLNGRESFSAGWPGRELSWSDVPPELMAAVDVYKNPSSELVEGGISSQINLRTRLPFDQKGAMGALSLSDNYTALGKKNSPAVSGLYSNRWNTRYGEFGALVDLSYNKFKSRYDSMGLSAYYPRTNDVVPGKTVWVPDSASWGTGDGVSERKGFYGALQWKKDNFETALTYFDSDYTQTDANHSIFTAGAYAYDTQYSNAKFDDKGVFQSGTLTYPAGKGLNQYAAGGLNMGTTANLSHVGARTRELAWNAKWRANESWVFQNDLQWVHATNHADGALVNLGTFVPSMTMDVTGSMPKLSFDPAAAKFLADPNNYFWDSVQPALNRAKADLYAWKADAKYTFDSPVLRDFRFGVRVTERSSTKQNASGNTWTSIAEPWGITQTKVPGTLPTPTDAKGSRANYPYLGNYQIPGGVEAFAFPDFFAGKMAAPPPIVTASMPLVQTYWQNQYKQLMDLRIKQCQDAAAYTNDPDRAAKCADYNKDWQPLAFTDQPKDISKHSEGTQAIYGTLRFGFDDWRFPVDGNTGVRVVRTKSIAHGYTIFKPGYSPSTDPTLPRFGEIDQKLDAGGSHIDVIPSLNVKVNWSDKLQSRLALSKNIYRPGFDQLQEYITLNQQPIWDSSGSKIAFVKYTGTNSGNAQLKPLKSTGLDLTLEWYPRDGQSLTTAFFAKKVKDIIMTESYVRTLKDLAGNDQDFLVTGPANAARLWEVGIEVAGMTYLDKLPVLDKALPDWMKGFGVSSNFTYLKGKQSLYHPFDLKYCQSGNSGVAGNLYGCDTNGMPFKDLPVPYLSRRAFNFALMYDRGPVSLRLAYSWRDRFLQATNAYGANGWDGTSADPARIAANGGVAPKDVGWGLPVWQEATGQWDGGLNYKFNDNLYASANVSNLTNAVTRQTQQQSFGYSLRSVYAPGRSFRVSMGYAFW
ncbi:TonB-dependent receptor [Massilia sp. TW-1]|uniref:TonB-dependent receptor n=1 Tax=Telluria antibiotica TaxID=2717319 RepID=A0ABX0PAJ2_9BURK|nr:TonB-dependent receptor [Telluria antibiotica]NIA54335.1 TonB-dependent receptor [Telluria antibiotica]